MNDENVVEDDLEFFEDWLDECRTCGELIGEALECSCDFLQGEY